MGIREYIAERGRQEGWQKGWQEGQQEGWQRGRQEFILNMLKKDLNISLISDVTGLSEEEIKKLKK